ncbi:CCA tRNA nucleotidyltransferase [Oceanirhabdus sp. W0125-5]|uniref:CCA tRNA nucleotidyltransferase n=1 Tax=Oceanirhabdus sp. W0125-5 TaxID=2999116 RepID=UPI0022F2E1C4|nr:CCA tRNA nucleotidyltransferase [Oceanirhabdus sp. W0125-5]WBW97512.1 CCA tRNA nucleotidyltransferase [Oceanirhabdus sp. W0125-5]
MKASIIIPKDAALIIDELYNIGKEGFVVGGCVRDSLLGLKPKDWDITTSASPQLVKETFEKLGFRVIETGIKHGTVTVMVNKEPFEITTYRIEGEYIDNRRPSNVEYTDSLKEDLIRRDFTINAMAYNSVVGLVDHFNGREHLNEKVIKCVGDASKRFSEDALRMMRAIRFSSQLNFQINESTFEKIKENANLISNISNERIKDELNKILLSENPSQGVRKMVEAGVMVHIIPEIMKCVGFDQKNKYHDKDVFEHILTVLDNCPKDLEIRLAALFHDIAKPDCYTEDIKGGHFYRHEIFGSEMAEKILKRLKYDNKTIENVVNLVREHMFKGKGIKRKAIKRMISRIGEVNAFKLFIIQEADCKASAPGHKSTLDVEIMREKTQQIIMMNEPMRVSDLCIKGSDIIKLGVTPGPEIGEILRYLLELCLEDPDKNKRQILLNIVKHEFINRNSEI